jgi:hypothetical protein
VLFNKSQSTLIQYPSGLGGSYTVPGGVLSIGAYAFEQCAGLTSATIPASVTNIGEFAFGACPSLASVYFLGNPPNASTIEGYGVFTDYPFSPPLDHAKVYYLPGTSGWSTFFAELPTTQWNPQIQAGAASFGVTNNQFGFTITANQNLTVVVEACTNLANPIWTPLQTVTLANGSYYFSEPLQTNISSRFYGLGVP